MTWLATYICIFADNVAAGAHLFSEATQFIRNRLGGKALYTYRGQRNYKRDLFGVGTAKDERLQFSCAAAGF
ncbi:hypothetical protein MKJ04_11425 [Pontibacter sp. E15-1]|uniref:hypothetical protein n=1 Tax=Pontibacter sp. E15-1 TaxID=2919918 RepID=UPI001F4F88FE|nr:hypothetical protein [Pontibacter sp. E15-1]MCJ8165454.1 hypothetical protein [Pontibacter sp. E15-1]